MRKPKRGLDDRFRLPIARSGAYEGTMTELMQSPVCGGYQGELEKVNCRFLRPKNPFYADVAQTQASFEPENWVTPIRTQLDLLTRVYFPTAMADQDYLEQRLADPQVEHFVRVAFPKIAFYERLYGLKDGYKQIGIPIGGICDHLAEQRALTNYRRGQLDPYRVYFHPETEEARRQYEEGIPGDVMIVDVDLANWVLGGGKECHSPRWSREEVLIGSDLFALSATDVGVTVLTNPNRLQRLGDLCIDAVAEVYVWGTAPSCSLCWFAVDGELYFDHRDAASAYTDAAAAVGLRPGVTGLS
jgi:hypothetical protein